MAKYHVVDFSAQLPDNLRKEAAEFILSVQPISSEHKGIWREIEHFLVKYLNSDLVGFSNFCVALAKKNSSNWLEVLKAPQCFDWFLSELTGKDVRQMVGKLVFSPSEGCRRLGLFLFDKLRTITLPKEMLNEIGETQLKLAFYEFQQGLMDGETAARFLISLIPQVQLIDLEFQNEFYDELVLQLKNYGSCREECRRRMEEFPILKRAIKEIDDYFDAFRLVLQSSISAMEVAGYRQAVRLYSRQFSNAISKGSEEASVLMKLIKKVQLLYGKAWSSFYDGKLRESSGLQEFSSSIEMPRLEEIDPEGMMLRRLYAATKISELSKSIQINER